MKNYQNCTEKEEFPGLLMIFSSQGSLGASKSSYLELSQGETAAGADSSVVLDGRASYNRSELVDGTGSQGSSLGLASSASPRLLAGLFPQVNILKYSKPWGR